MGLVNESRALVLLSGFTALPLALPHYFHGEPGLIHQFLPFVHVLTFAISVGTQFWVTFIAGPVMFMNLPKQTFGHIQGKLFPRYFQFLTLLNIISILDFIFLVKPANSMELSSENMTQLYTFFATLVFTMTNLLVVEPATTAVMKLRHKLHRDLGDSVDDSVEMKNLNKQFGMWHGISSLLNLFNLAGYLFHAYFIAAKLQFRA
eukprot:GFYU01021622.1.p1 GENE.GFYU01021622.1~~GFYU01021622.1.p1  ORF type:complete len:205 (+),score=54.42 GFYU01021622.1:131-745(+)